MLGGRPMCCLIQNSPSATGFLDTSYSQRLFFLDQRMKLLFKQYAFSNGFLEALFGGRSLDCGAMMNEVEGER